MASAGCEVPRPARRARGSATPAAPTAAAPAAAAAVLPEGAASPLESRAVGTRAEVEACPAGALASAGAAAPGAWLVPAARCGSSAGAAQPRMTAQARRAAAAMRPSDEATSDDSTCTPVWPGLRRDAAPWQSSADAIPALTSARARNSRECASTERPAKRSEKGPDAELATEPVRTTMLLEAMRAGRSARRAAMPRPAAPRTTDAWSSASDASGLARSTLIRETEGARARPEASSDEAALAVLAAASELGAPIAAAAACGTLTTLSARCPTRRCRTGGLVEPDAGSSLSSSSLSPSATKEPPE